MARNTQQYRIDIFRMNQVGEDDPDRFLWRVYTGEEREFEDFSTSERQAKLDAERFIRDFRPHKTLITTFYVNGGR